MYSDVTLVVAVVFGAFAVFGFTLAYAQWITGPGAPTTEPARSKVEAPTAARKIVRLGEHKHA